MNNSVRRRLDAAARVRELGRAHPFTDPVEAEIATRFEGLVEQATVQLREARAGQLAATAATRHRKQVRGRLHDEVRILGRVAVLAAREDPSAEVMTRVPAGKAANAVLLSDARDKVTAATSRRELLARHGMRAGQLEAITALADEFEQATARGAEAINAKNLARGALATVMKELADVVRLLDAVNRPRFAGSPGLLLAWTRAKNIVGNGPPAVQSSTGGGPATGGEVAA